MIKEREREIKHLSVHQWLRPAIPDSQQPTSPIGFLFLKLPPPQCAVLLVSKFPPSWNFKLTWSVHKGKMISKFPPPWNFQLIQSVHKVKMISKFPPPWHLTLVDTPSQFEVPVSTRVR